MCSPQLPAAKKKKRKTPPPRAREDRDRIFPSGDSRTCSESLFSSLNSINTFPATPYPLQSCAIAASWCERSAAASAEEKDTAEQSRREGVRKADLAVTIKHNAFR